MERRKKYEYHGMNGTKIYSAWKHMKQRCYGKNVWAYKYYGARGITICDEWKNSFFSYYNFVSQLENYGVEGYTLDRIENDGNYEPNNVKYSTKSEQDSNRRIYGTSKFKGVSWYKPKNKWMSYIKINGKQKNLGYFVDEIEASNAYQKALKEHISPKLMK